MPEGSDTSQRVTADSGGKQLRSDVLKIRSNAVTVVESENSTREIAIIRAEAVPEDIEAARVRHSSLSIGDIWIGTDGKSRDVG